MFINKYSLVAKKMLADGREKSGRPELCCLLVKKDRVIATDAKVFIEIENPKEGKLGDFVESGVKSTDEDVLLDKDTIICIEKNIRKKPTYPVPTTLIGKEKDEIQVVIPMGTKIPLIARVKQTLSNNKYPDIKLAYPKGELKLSVIFDIDLLQKVLSTVKGLSDRMNKDIKFTFYGKGHKKYTDPVKFEFKNPDTANAKGAIMPKSEI